MVHKACKALRATPVQQDLKANRDPKGCKALRATRALQARKVSRAFKVSKALRGNEVQPAHAGPQDSVVRPAPPCLKR